MEAEEKVLLKTQVRTKFFSYYNYVLVHVKHIEETNLEYNVLFTLLKFKLVLNNWFEEQLFYMPFNKLGLVAFQVQNVDSTQVASGFATCHDYSLQIF